MVYARTIGERVYSFEPSGGLINGALVMNDFETGSYWYLMNHTALAGPAKGQRLKELPVWRKARWKDWVREHPKTQVLSVRGREDIAVSPYANYFASKQGFRGLSTPDRRLGAKVSIYSWLSGEQAYCAPFSAFEGEGAVFDVGETQVLIHRPKGVAIFHSSQAWGGRFRRQGEGWLEVESGAVFDPASGRWKGKQLPRRLEGFDTFWVSWSLAHPKTRVLGQVKAEGKPRGF